MAVMEADDNKEIEIPLDGLLKEISNLSESLGFTGDVVIEDVDLQEEELFEMGDPVMDEDYVEETVATADEIKEVDAMEELLAELDWA